MTTTPNMGLILPVDGGSPNVWNTILDQVLTQIDSHNHTTGQGVQIPVGGLAIAADLTFAGNSAIHLKASVFDQVAVGVVAGYANALFVNSADANLYFRNAGGTNVQLTAGNTINVSLVGGIGGDYSSVSALVQYNDATRTYWLQQEGSPRPWAKLGTGDINLYQAAASIVNSVNMKSPNALAASYTLTYPAAAPASATALWAVDSTGLMTFVGNTFANPATTIYANDFKVAVGTVLQIPPGMWLGNGDQLQADPHGVFAWKLSGGTGAAGQMTIPLPLRVGDQVTNVKVYVNKVSDNTNTITLGIRTYTQAGGETNSATALLSTNAPGQTNFSIASGTLGSTYTAAAGVTMQVWVGMSLAPSAGNDIAYLVEITYTRP